METHERIGGGCSFEPANGAAAGVRRTRPTRARRRPADLRRAFDGDLAELEREDLVRLLFGARGAPAGELVEHDLDRLSRATPAELEHRFALGARDAARLASAFELGRRAAAASRKPRLPCHSAECAFDIVSPLVAGIECERFVVLLLDGKHRLQRVHVVSEGTLTTALVHPREVFRAAVREAAAAVLVAHNHPSGDPEPSAEDLAVTRRLRRAGRLLGIPLVDHLVVGDGRYVSLRDRAK